MRLYEGLFLFDANLASRDWPGLEKHIAELFKKHSGELVYSERWPDRKLAYEIKGCRKGVYYLTYFQSTPENIVGLRRDLELSERVLRYQFIQNEYVPELLEKRKNREAEAAARAAEEAAAKEKEAQEREAKEKEAKEKEAGGTDAATAETSDAEAPSGDGAEAAAVAGAGDGSS